MVLQKHELNGSEKLITDIGIAQSFSKINTYLILYLNFNVTTANTTVRIVTTQNLTAILLSWYPNF